MKFTELNEILQLKIKKSLLKYNFDLSLLDKSYVNLKNDFDVESIYCQNYELIFEKNSPVEINSIIYKNKKL
jgi:hypothetical protein